MTAKYAGGCQHVHVTASAEPIDNHECHCNVCKSVTKQHTTHVAFFKYADLNVDHPEKIKRVPFNANNPNGPLEICVCSDCGAALRQAGTQASRDTCNKVRSLPRRCRRS